MPDREKVIKGLERCSGGRLNPCFGCPYDEEETDDFCEDILMKDAIALLKEQEPVEPTYNESHLYVSDAFRCGVCGCLVNFHAKYCQNCGRKVKWDA